MARDTIWLGWTPRESGSKGFRCIFGDAGKAYGKYQFDYRYGLLPFMIYCQQQSSHYKGFTKFIQMGAANTALIYNSDLGTLWTQYCNKYPQEFEQLQDEAAYEQYYLPMKNYCLKHGINIGSGYSAALRGSLFSMAIRSGTESAAKKMINNMGVQPEEALIRALYATYGNADANRWTEAGQLGDALKAFHSEGIETEQYFVGTSWKDGKCQEQHNAFYSLDNAKRDAANAAAVLKKTYYVFDQNGVKKFTAAYSTPVTPSEPENKPEPIKPTKYYVGTKWQVTNGYTVENQKGMFESLDNAKKCCDDAADKENKTYYVFEDDGDVVYAAKVEVSLPAEDELYRIGTGWKDGKCVNQHNAFTVYENALEDYQDAQEASPLLQYFIYNKKGEIVYPDEKNIHTPFMYKVDVKVPIYKSPAGKKTGNTCPVGTFTITAVEVDGTDVWGKLKSGLGWIPLNDL